MIEAIEKIPLKILEGQLKNVDNFNEKEKFIVVFLNNEFGIDKIGEGNYEEICEKSSNLTKLQKDLIIKFQEYRGVIDLGKDCNRKAFGGNQALATCSLLHFKLGSPTIHKNLFEDKNKKNIDNIFDKINGKKKVKYSNLIKKNKELVNLLKTVIEKLFIKIILEKKDYKNIKFDEFKIVIIPKQDSYIEKYNLFWEKFMKIQIGKTMDSEQNFNIDTFETNQTSKHGVLYSKIGKGNNFQTEENNKISKETYEKIDKLKKILQNKKFKGVLPLPLFDVKNQNVYQICFSDNSLLKKLQEIYKYNNNKPFNYILISNNEGYRFENIINFDFIIDNLINSQIYNLDFNNCKRKNEIQKINNPNRRHDKYELLFDILSLFWIIKNEEKNEYKQMSFFNPEIKNSFLDMVLKENSESIINQIFKNGNEFINFKLQKVINRILNEILHNGETQKQFSSKENLKRLLLISLKYEKEKMKSKEVKIIEGKLDIFKKDQELEVIENDFEAYFYAGLIFKHLIGASVSSKKELGIASTYLLSIATTKQLKEKIALLTTQYSHNLNVNSQMWNILNKFLLEYEFLDNKLKNNLIPFFIGYYTDFWISKSKEKSLKDDECNNLGEEENE